MKRAEKAFDDMFAAFLITFSAAAYEYENYVTEKIMNLLRPAVFIVFILLWIALSVKNGKKGSISFPIFAVLFWILPLAVIHISNYGPWIFRMSIICYVLSEFFDLLINTPLCILADMLGISRIGALTALLLVLAAAYLSGMLIAYIKKKKAGTVEE